MKASTIVSRRRATLLVFLAVAGFAVAGLLSAPALAKQKSCAEQIVDDWYDNQRVDKLYPIHCYREAIAGLPLDIKDYSDAQDAILRALAYRQANQTDPGADAGGTIKPIAYRRTADVVSALPDPGLTSGDPAASTSGPSSVPIPLIVLAGLAGLLLLAGGAGYVARRAQSRRGDPPSTQ